MGTKNFLNLSFVRQSTQSKEERAGSNPGLLPGVMMAAPSSDFSLTNAAGVQSAFPTTCDVITVEASTTYEFEGTYIINNATTNTHTTAMAFALGGGASITSFEYTAILWAAAANTIATTQSTTHVSGVASKILNATSAAAYRIITFKGIARINAGGTITPQINFSVGPGTTNLMKIGSYIKFTPIGTSSFVSVGNIA